MVEIISLKTKRKAVAMIELIFAIVVMGFAMLAIPNITAQSAKSSQSAINQEAVAAAAAQMQNILSSHWDAEDTGANGSPILSLNGAAITDRPGRDSREIYDNSGEILSASATSVAAIGTDDMGDYNGLNTPIEIIENSQDYSDKKLNMLSTVLYTTDDTGAYNFDPSVTDGGITNIKKVSVALTSAETSQENKNVTLHAFSCNIGVPTLNSKQVP